MVRVVAVDKDAGDNGRVSYVITSANEEARFSVGYESGIVSLERPMARSTELEITANDHGSPPRKSTLRLILSLASGQTNGPPRLLLANPVARISEDLQVGAPVLNVAGPIIADQGEQSPAILSRAAKSTPRFFHLHPIGVPPDKFIRSVYARNTRAKGRKERRITGETKAGLGRDLSLARIRTRATRTKNGACTLFRLFRSPYCLDAAQSGEQNRGGCQFSARATNGT